MMVMPSAAHTWPMPAHAVICARRMFVGPRGAIPSHVAEQRCKCCGDRCCRMRCVARTDEHHHGSRRVDGGQLAVQQAPPQVPDLVACAVPPVCWPRREHMHVGSGALRDHGFSLQRGQAVLGPQTRHCAGLGMGWQPAGGRVAGWRPCRGAPEMAATAARPEADLKPKLRFHTATSAAMSGLTSEPLLFCISGSPPLVPMKCSVMLSPAPCRQCSSTIWCSTGQSQLEMPHRCK